MPVRYSFHPEAQAEYKEAANYYGREASPQVAKRFLTAVESALAILADAPTRWRIVEEPEVRRCKIKRFPFSIFYRWNSLRERIVIYAVMHDSREPGYWQHRVGAEA